MSTTSFAKTGKIRVTPNFWMVVYSTFTIILSHIQYVWDDRTVKIAESVFLFTVNQTNCRKQKALFLYIPDSIQLCWNSIHVHYHSKVWGHPNFSCFPVFANEVVDIYWIAWIGTKVSTEQPMVKKGLIYDYPSNWLNWTEEWNLTGFTHFLHRNMCFNIFFP